MIYQEWPNPGRWLTSIAKTQLDKPESQNKVWWNQQPNAMSDSGLFEAWIFNLIFWETKNTSMSLLLWLVKAIPEILKPLCSVHAWVPMRMLISQPMHFVSYSHSWASALRPLPPASVFRHPESQTGTVAFRYRTGVHLFRYRTVRHSDIFWQNCTKVRVR